MANITSQIHKNGWIWQTHHNTIRIVKSIAWFCLDVVTPYSSSCVSIKRWKIRKRKKIRYKTDWVTVKSTPKRNGQQIKYRIFKDFFFWLTVIETTAVEQPTNAKTKFICARMTARALVFFPISIEHEWQKPSTIRFSSQFSLTLTLKAMKY